MWVDGEPVAAELLDAGAARRTYEEIVRSLRDPALLEYVTAV
jgi:Ca-activated chloride channel family protein